MFKEPFPKHDKGKAKVTDDQTNYTRASYNYDSIVNHISMDNYVSTIIIKDKTLDNSTQRPKIILKGIGSSSEPTSECNVTTRQGKFTLKSAPNKNTTSSSTKPEYDLVEQLGKTPTLISILELLRISPAHKAILDKVLRDTPVPTDLNVDQFQAMVGYLSVPHSLTFTEADDASVSQPHNAPLHIEAFIHKHQIKQVLIDGGAGLNICTLSTIKQLGYLDKVVNATNKITIKAYDDEERSSKGTVILPLRVGPVTKDVICQVLDLDLTYNILLGRPWIHEMRAVPSTYHRCIKFPHNGVEVTIKADPNPFIYCNNLRPRSEITIPVNREAIPSSTYVDPKSLKSFTSKQAEIKEKFKIKDMGCCEYIFHVDQLPLSPKVFSRQEQSINNLQYQGIRCEPPSVVATKSECKSPLVVQVALDINSPKSGSSKESIEHIAISLENSHSLTISSTHSIFTPLPDLDQQELQKPLLTGDEKSSYEQKKLKVKTKEKSFSPNQNQKLLDSAKIKVKDKNPIKKKRKR
ncbi:hypothetical protein SUGI_0046600 [Cryptomeria japonica]|nr:hypothetical protein SUGI_0046600 [Cryptomeria japonica]